jgi:hypothetical protein
MENSLVILKVALEISAMSPARRMKAILAGLVPSIVAAM